jgi:HD-GYP domain-containing protein (c-di-GMP phosphodiesterase class II)
MTEVKPSRSIIGKTLAKDVYNEYGLLLLPAGVILHQSDIRLLCSHQVRTVFVADQNEITDLQNPFPYLYQDDVAGARQYTMAVVRMEQLFQQVTLGQIPALQQFSQAFTPILDYVLPNSSFLRFVYQMGGTDNYLARHSIHVGILSALIGKIMGMPQKKIRLLGQAGLLHDIGKLHIPDELLSKPNQLDASEYEIMKKHTIYGNQIITDMEGAHPMMALCALLHHERSDGSGYPLRWTKQETPLECQIVGVADFFDALCTDRVYRNGISPFEAANLLWEQACSRKLLASIVSSFVQYIAMLYIGSQAMLNTGDSVEILLIHKDEPTRPLVRRGEEFLDLRQYRSLHITKMIG